MTMNAPDAIRGCYSDLRLVRGRKVAVIHIEIPIEQAASFVAGFGVPDPAAETWVALARLNPPASQEQWKPDRLNEAKMCALTCKKETFWQFLREDRETRCEDEVDAATYVRGFCRVNSRAVIATDERAYMRWSFLASAYDDWMKRPA